MKTLEVDFLIYDANSPKETRVTLRIPVVPAYAQQLLDAQNKGLTVTAQTAQTALYNMAGAIGFLNGCRGIPLRVREVRE